MGRDGARALTQAQLGIWFGQLLEPRSAGYHIGECLEIAGPVDRDRFERALQATVDATDALRLRFIDTEDGPRQYVADHVSAEMVYVDRDAHAWMRADMARPFDRDRLFTFALLKAVPDRFYWYARYHHLIADGLSMNLIARRVAACYSSAEAFDGSWLELVDEEERYRGSEQHQRDREFWREQLRDRPEPLTLSGKAPELATAFELRSAEVDRAVGDRLRALGKPHGATFAQVIVAATAAYLARLTGARDVTIGLTISGRTSKRARDIAGMASKSLPLRLRIEPGATMGELLRHCVRAIADVVEHQRYSEEDLRRDLGLQPHEQLYGTDVNVMAFDYDLRFDGHRVVDARYAGNWRINDLAVNVHDNRGDGPLRVDLVANPDHYSNAELDAQHRRFVAFLQSFADVPVYRLPMDCGGKAAAFESSGEAAAVHQLIEHQAQLTPHATAVIAGDESLTYAELDARANRLAHELIARGAEPEAVIGVSLERSLELVIALLATLKSGAAYLPLDPNYPPARLQYMIDDAAPLLVITKVDPSLDRPCDAPDVALSPAHPAYVIYTSGSTGPPKGVAVDHRALAAKISTLVPFLGIHTGTRYAATTSISFDPLLEQILCPLAAGAASVIVPDAVRDDAQRFARYAKRHAISVFDASPALIAGLMRAGELTMPLDALLIGGDVLPPRIASAVLESRVAKRVLNFYGPTEACIDATVYEVTGTDGPSVPIGSPLPNYRLYVLDSGLEPMPQGIAGELYIAGPGLARGYRGRPALTAERFVADPFATGERMYRTGDLARWRNNILDFLGRADRQVKIRGFRIEPGEIEAALTSQPSVAQAAVTVRDGNQLVAYVAADSGASIDRAALRRALAAKLPEHMVPSAFVVLPEMPLTPNGKIDRNALPAPERPRETYRAPSTREEEILCTIFAELLKLERVGIDDNFFAHGGDSILSIQLLTRARRAGLDLEPGAIFKHTTVAALASYGVRRHQPPLSTRQPQLPHSKAIPTPIMRAFFAHAGKNANYRQAMRIPVPEGRTQEQFEIALQAVIKAHGLNDVEVTWRDRAITISIHHLHIDGVSWRILLPDLEAAWSAVARGETPHIEPPPTSFAEWSQFLAERAHDPEIVAELDRWLEPVHPWRNTALEKSDTFATARTIRTELPVDLTNALLTTVPAAFHARINDVLLAALAIALGDTVTIDMEGHGREPLDADLDLSRTIGWFTSIFPVTLDTHGQTEPTRVLKHIKECLRAVPHRGLGYGLLRYLNEETAPRFANIAEPQIGFNYLGRFTGHDELTAEADPSMPLFHLLDIDAQTTDGADGPRLSAKWTFAAQRIDEADVRALAARWMHALEALVEQAQLGGGHTPSDFPLLHLTQNEIERLEVFHPGLEDVLPLSPLQEGLVFHTLYDEGVPDLYTVQLVLDLEGQLDASRMHRAAETMLSRHANLRVAVRHEGLPRAVQVIARDVVLPWSDIDLSMLDAPAQKARREELLAADRAQRFVLSEAPLLRVMRIALADDRNLIVITNHHMLMDGWSTPLFVGELLALYRNEDLPPARAYADYLAWLERQDKTSALDAWRDALHDLDEPSRLVPARATGAAPVMPERWMRELPEELTSCLQRAARDRAITLNTLVQGLWAVLLSRLTGRDDVVFGVTMSERPVEVAGAEQMIGLLINTVPVRVQVRPAQTLSELFAALQLEHARMLPFTHAGLAEIQRAVGLGELFDTLMVFENYPLDRAQLASDADGLRLVGLEGHDTANYPLTLVVVPGERMLLRLEHDPASIDRAQANVIGARLVHLLEAAVADPDVPLHRLDILDAGEREMLSRMECGCDSCRFPKRRQSRRDAQSTIIDAFASHVASTPDAIALEGGGCGHRSESGSCRCRTPKVTYRQLDARANRIAHLLIARGVRTDDLVGLSMPRSLDTIAAILGILKAGGAYVPIDAELPPLRREQLIEDCALRHLVTVESERDFYAHAVERVITFDDLTNECDNEPGIFVHPDNIAYVNFTSGSTGKPKGVLVPHRGVVRLARDQNYGALDSQSRLLQLAPLIFDAATFEIWGALLNGGVLAIAPAGRLNIDEIGAAIQRHRVNTLFLTSGLFVQMVNDGIQWLTGVRQLFSGGDVVPAEQVLALRTAHPQCRIVNAYGPTENTTYTTCYPVPPHDELRNGVSIGSPINNTRVYVLDANLQPLPIGVAGELYTSGAGLARGYLHRAALTAERFVADPFSHEEGARMYRTGDLARWRHDGTIDFLGRTDGQVKLRGFRIELGEIEAALMAHADVAQAVVIARDDGPGGRQLVAYVVATPHPAFGHPLPASGATAALGSLLPSARGEGARRADEGLREYLADRLPEFMIPAAFVVLDALPYRSNGKLDRGALPAPQWHIAHDSKPRTPDEEVLCAIFADVLLLENFGVDDNFFHHGGHSLLATRLASRIRVELGVELAIRTIFEAPTVARLATRLRGGDALRPPVIRVARPERVPLSYAQQRLWFLDQLEGASTEYNMVHALRLRGDLDVAALQRALQTIVDRHESLRTAFMQVDGVAYQVIQDGFAGVPRGSSGSSADWLQLPEERRGTPRNPRNLISRERDTPFDLTRGPLFRAHLSKLAEREHILLLTFHHIVTDGWSMDVFYRELAALYDGQQLEPLPVQYADFALWQRANVDRHTRGLAYWKQQLADLPERLALPADHPRPAVPTYRGATCNITLGAAHVAALKEISTASSGTFYMTLLAAFALLLERYSGQQDLVIGSPIANRQDRALEPLIGFFVNSLAMRVRTAGLVTFDELLAHVRRTTFDAYLHQDVPFERVVEHVSPERTASHAPLFQVVFALQNAPMRAPRLAGLEVEAMNDDELPVRVDLEVHATERDGMLDIAWAYNRDLFERPRMEQMAQHFILLLEAIANAPHGPLHALGRPLTPSPSPRKRGEGGRRPGEGPTLPELFEAQVARNPHALAVISGDEQLTYQDLNDRANALAHDLIARGAGPESRVGICLERSIEQIIAVLATAKAGAAYLPLDPQLPSARLVALAEEASPTVVLTAATFPELPESAANPTDADRTAPLRVEHPAYVIFTSGSAGTPKGVVVTHAGIASLATAQIERLGITNTSRVLMYASLNFDASLSELVMTLTSGATLVLLREDQRAGMPLRDVLVRHRVTHATIPPVVLATLSACDYPALEGLIVAGDACPGELVARWSPGRTMINAYGPTETTVCATMSEPLFGSEAPPIGTPINHTRVYVLDARLEPAPIGANGELYIAGIGLARGYLGRAALTAERFVADPHGEPGTRMYRTGDLARRRTDGALEFLGRADQQIKLRGFRIEPAEIEAALLAVEGITQAAVLVRDQRLVAYIAGPPLTPPSANVAFSPPQRGEGARRADEGSIRRALAERLPDYMVPAAIVQLDAFPLNTSGKLDRAALPTPILERDRYRAPRTRAEEIVSALIAELLSIDRVGLDDNFFTLGGDSIVSIQLVSRARKAGLELMPRDVFRHQTVEALAAAAKVAAEPVAYDEQAAIGELAPTPLMRWFLDRSGSAIDRFHQSMTFDIDTDQATLIAALQALIDTHHVLRMRLKREHDWMLEIPPRGTIDAAALFGARLDPYAGRMIEARWSDKKLRLAIHHLAVDAVSWHILHDDLRAALRGEVLPPEPTPFKVWSAAALAAAFQSGSKAAAILDPQQDTFATAAHLAIEIPAKLITNIATAFHARIDEVLLAALAIAADETIVVDIESHGRDGALDLSRTVGWFTAQLPIAIGGTLQQVKEQLRAKQAASQPPQIGFNYLGRLASAAGDALPDDAMPLFHPLDINAHLLDDTLIATWTWATRHRSEEEIRVLAERWRRTIEQLANETGGHSPSDFPLVALSQEEVDRLDREYPQLESILPLAPLQEGLLFHAVYDTGADDIYAVQFALELEGALDVDRLRNAAQALLDRHANLRAAFHHDRAGRALQVIARDVKAIWSDGLSARRSIDELMAADRAKRFDLTCAPLLRMQLVRTDDNRHVLLFTTHHILMDGWSLPLFFDELFALYRDPNALSHARPYADYLQWLRDQDADAALRTWREYLADLEEPTRVAPAKTGAAKRSESALSPELSASLQTLARERGLTLNTIVQGLWAVLIGRLTGRDEVVFGATVSGRPAELPGVERMIGLFINTLPVRVQLRPGASLTDLLRGIQQSQSALMSVQHVGLADIQRELGIGELFDSLVVFENYPLDGTGLTRADDELRVTSTFGRDATHYPLTLMFEPGTRMRMRLDCTFDRGEEIAARFVRLLETAIAQPDALLHQLDPIDAPFAHQTTHTIRATTIAQLLHEQAVRTPDHIAVIFEDTALTYADFDLRTNELAQSLVAQGVGPESIVGVALERSIELVIALVAIVKAGGAYLPLDPDYPEARIEQMLEDAAPQVVLSASSVVNQSTTEGTESTEALPLNPAYVIYTSGSTGKPKGVPNTHEGLLNRILWMQSAYTLGAGDRVLQKTPYSFDVSVWEFFWPLVTGATLVVAPPGAHRDPDALAQLIDTHRITTMHFVPSMLRAFLADRRALPSLKRVLCSGEALPGDLQAQFFERLPHVELHNLYGPTEASIDVTAWQCRKEDGDATPPIGAPIWNTRLYVLDAGLQPVPIGVAGDLYLAGIGLARGYHARRALTADRFVADPYAHVPGGRMYRTGDRAQWRIDGTLDFLGRSDSQVKIRGLRIELGEIEAALLALDGITQAAVIVRDQQLVAYVVGGEVDRDALAQRLPDFMIPSAFVTLDELPLTPSGKLDRRALECGSKAAAFKTAAKPPRTPAESVLCGLFAEVLRIETVGITDNFFRIGGDSILSIQLVSRARKAGFTLTPRDVFEHPTVEALALLERRALSPSASMEETGDVPLTPIMRWWLDRRGAAKCFYQSMSIEVPPGIDEPKMLAALQTLLDHHAMLRLRLVGDRLHIAPRGSVSAKDCLVGEPDLDPRAGRLFAAIWHDNRLTLHIHHLAVDAVSWQILLPDLDAAWRGEPLDPVPTPFEVWARQHLAQSREDRAFWEAMLPLRADDEPSLDPTRDTFATARHLEIAIPARALLTTVPALFHAGVNDVLLTALTLAVNEVYGTPALIDVEGHGRESSFDLSRTVGWFTSLYPVLLHGNTIKEIKEQLRRVPNHGLGYGLLRYLDGVLTDRSEPRIGFNYLGRLDAIGGLGGDAAPDTPLAHIIELNAFADRDSRLHATFTWAANHASESEVRALAHEFQRALESLARLDAGGHTPSDFPLVSLSQAEVERLEVECPNLEDILPLAPLQEGLLFHSLYENGGRETYALQVSLELEGHLDVGRLRAAAQSLLARHANLRASVHYEGLGRPVQVISRNVTPIWTDGLSARRPTENPSLQAIIDADREQRFDLATAPLLRFTLLRLDEPRHVLLLTAHHLLIDGWSLPLLLDELFTLYRDAIPARPRPYRDYLAWLAAQDRDVALDVWRDYLRGLDEPTRILERRALSPSYPGEADGLRARRSRTIQLPRELSGQLQSLARERGLTLSTLIQGLWAVLVSRLTGRDDVVFGVTVAGRPPLDDGVDRMLGLFINTLPLRAQIRPDQKLSELLAEVQRSQSRLMSVQYVALADIQHAAGIGELFDSLVVFENYPLSDAALTSVDHELRITAAEGRDETHYPLGLLVAPGERLLVRLDYDPVRIEHDAAEDIAARFVQLLHAAADDLDAPVAKLDILRDGERDMLLDRFNATAQDTGFFTFLEMFEEHATRDPHATAILFGDERMSYGDLNAEANRLAHHLITLGIRADDRVGVLLERSARAIVAVLAILKSGAAYLPLDPSHPRLRLMQTLDDAQPALILTNEKLREHTGDDVPVILVDRATLDDSPSWNPCDEDRALPLFPEHAAYVIYTSGSTGTPKGVVVTHAGIPPMAAVHIDRLGIGKGSRVLQYASLSFDVAAAEITMTLGAGATLVLLREDERVGAALHGVLRSQQVTHVMLTPPVLETLGDPDDLFLEGLVVGGEVCPPELVARWSRGRRMVNAYGPTETTVCATLSEPLHANGEVPPLGAPVWNTRVYVLDRNLEPAPIGVTGELYIAGTGLARGYRTRPALTAERFVADPHARIAGARMYRSGDLARWRDDGTLTFLGRADQQVKVRGFRIEPGEIEAALLSIEGIAQAAVIARDGNLVAYIAPHPAFGHPLPASGARATNGDLLPAARGEGARRADEGSIREALATRLPAFMIPSAFVVMDALPLLPNGKLDRRALPAPERTKQSRPPRTPDEEILCSVFAEILGLDEVGIDDHFFELGGHSLLATRVISRVGPLFGVDLSVRAIFEHPRVIELASELQRLRETHADAVEEVTF